MPKELGLFYAVLPNVPLYIFGTSSLLSMSPLQQHIIV